ncbi:50S ribosomal subunit protein L19 [Candidatus Zinderia insecticola CARI]|uniref:50S ribosomal protein L19 n=1 Tax=Zinderia insecticola (strain CARI) TaxID=871271 RepID=E0TJ58_ZINIC|nr:50S ribosomal subunit protein L19 [Candidatus Zinderia insecticola CARI]
MNLINKIEKKKILKKKFPYFDSGDIISINLNIFENFKKKNQIFQGLVISRKNKGINTSFTLIKFSYGTWIKRIFKLYSYTINNIKILKKLKKKKKSKLYYLIKKKINF